MDKINQIIGLMNDFLWTYVLIGLLIIVGLYFTFKTKFVQFRKIKEMVLLLSEGSSKENKNSISSFQAFCIGTASRVGTGNLAGVATAIALGGPGAIFWMWLIALIGSASAFIESTLAQVYKIKDNDSFRGGPAYYIQQGLKKRWLGILFSIMLICAFGFAFNSVQSNTITLALQSAFNFDRTIVAIILTVLSAVIFFGGVQRIAKLSSILVPIMAGAYIIVSLIIITKNITLIPSVFSVIFKSAFGFKEAGAGAFGAAIMYGVKRGLFSNEAGMGSAPNAAATALVSHPVKQGLIQTLGVFTDTLIICSSTALIILLSGVPLDGSIKGIELTQLALISQVGNWGGVFIAICIFLFAFSSIIGNYYYGETNVQFITEKKIYLQLYRIAVALMVLWGGIASLEVVWNMADIFMALMATINLISIMLLGNIALKVSKDYFAQKASGINPVFNPDTISELKDINLEWETACINSKNIEI